MSQWDGLNRRRFPRGRYPCLISLRHGPEEVDALLTHTENIGVGGVCVILKKDIKLFTLVEVELDLLDLGEHVKCQGKVVWAVRRKQSVEKKRKFYDIGIEFADLEEKETHRLEGIISHLAKQNQKEQTP